MIATSAAPIFRASRPEPFSRPEPVSRSDAATDDTRDDNADDKRVARARPDFSLLLALLAGASPAARAEALRQLSPGNASLVDRLLNGAPETPTDESSETLFSTTANGAQSDATDALRYGLMQSGSRSSTREMSALLNDVLNESGDTDTLLGLSAGGLSRTGNASALDASLRASLLQASKRGARREQLLALGDSKGASVLAAMDALLAQAGTLEALAIANTGSGVGANFGTDPASLAAMHAAAHAAALAAANATSAADVTTPVRDPSALAPELRARLDRVIARMRDEYGSDVSIVETARSQERQDFLYAQGRTRQGPIVTWTHDSAHTRGEAVDVLVDGSWNNADGFARLQRIAREEGLRTLGLKDPGHLELARNGAQTDAAANVASLIERRAANVTVSATASQSASQASVAQVAGVAGVASVARVGERTAGADTSNGMPSAMSSYATMASANGSASSRSGGQDARNASSGEQNANTSSNGKGRVRQSGADNATSGYGTLNSAQSTTQNGTHTAAPTAAAAPAGIASAERVAEVQQLRADAPAGALSSMTLDVEGPNGMQRITVDLRGNTVGAQITTDAASADRLRAHTAELQDALGRHGLTADSVQITGSTRGESSVARVGQQEAIGMTQGATANGGADNQAMGQGPRDRGMAREWEKTDDARRARDEQRQGAGQRGQRSTYNQDPR